jgi:hypothetical protein
VGFKRTEKVDFADLSMLIVREVAQTMDLHAPRVNPHYKPGYLLRFVQRLHVEADTQFIKILDAFYERRSLPRKVRCVSMDDWRHTRIFIIFL